MTKPGPQPTNDRPASGCGAVARTIPEAVRVVGFTGTREWPTTRQFTELMRWFRRSPRGVLHHGDCQGADAEAHEIALYLGWSIDIHPGLGLEHLRAHKTGYTRLHPAKPHLDRNADIVALADELLACPAGPETLRSGTWSTIRKARARGIPITIIWPDGKVTMEPADGTGRDPSPPQTASQVPGTPNE